VTPSGRIRAWRRRRLDPDTFVPLPDSHPKRGLIAEPVRIGRLELVETELLGTQRRVTFLVEVRASDDARCPAIAVEARVSGPDRSRTVSGATDMLGRIRFRMTGAAGTYRCQILDVAAGGLDWDRQAGPDELTMTAD
jgi:hypothetical protein